MRIVSKPMQHRSFSASHIFVIDQPVEKCFSQLHWPQLNILSLFCAYATMTIGANKMAMFGPQFLVFIQNISAHDSFGWQKCEHEYPAVATSNEDTLLRDILAAMNKLNVKLLLLDRNAKL